MKIIHCADIHLDSALSTNMSSMQASERRKELLNTWVKMVEYGADNGVRVIIIAGDWFDTSNIFVNTADIIAGTIRKYSNMDFVYLPGNHDERACIGMLGKHKNLMVLDKECNSVRYDDVVIAAYGKKLQLKNEDVNIVVAHEELSDVKLLAGKNIDYLALGHIHKHMEGVIDQRGMWCYSGCLEARGFDESGEQGFVLLEVTAGRIIHTFVPFGYRHVHDITVDVVYESEESGMDTILLCDKIADRLVSIPGKDMVKVRIKGAMTPGDVINVSYINSYFKDKFYGFRIEDGTDMILDIDMLSRERSLKGEFIRAVLASDETDDMKRSIIRCGLSALIGEVTE